MCNKFSFWSRNVFFRRRVVSLFMSTLFMSIVIQKIWPDYDSALDLDGDVVLNLIRFCLFSNCFILNDVFYRQVDDSAMSPPLSDRISEIVIQYVKNKLLFILGSKL